MSADGREEEIAQVVGLPRTYALDHQQGIEGGGPKSRHIPKRHIMKNHVRRHAARSRDVEPDPTKLLEERSVDAFP